MTYDVELWKQGYADISSREEDASTRLQALANIQRQWDHIDNPVSHSSFPVNFTVLWRCQSYTMNEGTLLIMPFNDVKNIICRTTMPTDRLLQRIELNELFQTNQLTPHTIDVGQPFIGAHPFPHEDLLVLQRVISHVPDGALVSLYVLSILFNQFSSRVDTKASSLCPIAPISQSSLRLLLPGIRASVVEGWGATPESRMA